MAANDADPAASASLTNEPDFKLGDWWVRPQRNELDRTGEIAHVEARSMAVLVCLARHAPRVVSKQRLLDEVWSDSPYVGEEVISHAIWELRKALGDSAREPAYIQTVPRKGYVLLAEIVRPRGSPLPIVGARIDHYDILEELGRGSMGVVFKALDRRLERTVAIKFLAPELTRDHDACRRFLREAQLAAALDHPNLATVHAIGETSEGQHYLVTPFYAGGSLKEVCARGDLPAEAAIRFAVQLARGLAAAHAQGIVHRDIKPANLLIDEHGTLKIGDFGIAKLLGATDLTRTGVSLGTPAYKSPEQARGQEVDHRSDIWSMGVVFFEMLTGRRPFAGEFEQAVIHSILTADPAAETDARGNPIPEGLRRVVAKAMAREPGERYQRAVEVVGELEGLESGPRAGVAVAAARTPAAAPPLHRATSTAARPRTGRAALAGAAAVVLFSAGYGVWRLASNDPGGPPIDQVDRALAQGTGVWLRGNDDRNLEDVRGQLSGIARDAPERAEALALYALFLADAYGDRAEERGLAERLIRDALEIEPRSALARSAQARLHWQDGDFAAAAAAAREAIEIEPSCGLGGNCDLAYVWLADALWVIESPEAALRAVSAGVSEGGGHVRCRLKRAQLLGSMGRRAAAIEDYEEVLRAEPVQSTALNELGLLFLDGGRFDGAADLFKRLHDRTGDPRALLNQGNARYEQKRWHDALLLYQDALSQYVARGIRSALPMVALGDTYAELGEPDRARESYEMALGVFDGLVAGGDSSPSVRGPRAVCLAKLGRLAEAEAEVPALLAHAGTYSKVWVFAARIAALAGEREALLERSRRAAESGHSMHELTADAAFLAFRDDAEYRAHLERLTSPGETTDPRAGAAQPLPP